MSTYAITVTREADAWLAQCDQEPTATLGDPYSGRAASRDH